MSISAVSSSGGTYKSSDTSQIERQKESILQQIQQIKSSSDDEKTKQVKITKLQMQLQQLEAGAGSGQQLQSTTSFDSAASEQEKSEGNILYEYA